MRSKRYKQNRRSPKVSHVTQPTLPVLRSGKPDNSSPDKGRPQRSASKKGGFKISKFKSPCRDGVDYSKEEPPAQPRKKVKFYPDEERPRKNVFAGFDYSKNES